MKNERIAVLKIKAAVYNPSRDLCPADSKCKQMGADFDEFGLVKPLVFNSRTWDLVRGRRRLEMFIGSGTLPSKYTRHSQNPPYEQPPMMGF